MTNEEAGRLRVLMQEALDLVLARPIAFVLVAQNEDRNLEIVTNAARRELLPQLLEEAARITRTPSDGTIAIPDHRATGESAGDSAQAPGMECGHAAPSASSLPTSSSSSGTVTPAAPAVCERCAVNDTGTPCPNDAAGGLRLNFYATPTIQKRYGKRVMLSLIMDLPVCTQCMPKVTASNVVSNEQWNAFAKVAQQRNSGVLADRSQTEIVLCPFNDPEYVMLRDQIARQRAVAEAKQGPLAQEGA